MEEAQRETILRQGVVLPETPRDRRERAALDEDLRSLAGAGRPLSLRVRNFAPSADAYLSATRGPRPYMLRLREIETQRARHEEVLAEAWHAVAHESDGQIAFADRWRQIAGEVVFDEVNDLVDRHNRWYPIEAELPMDPRTGGYVLVGGRDYRLPALDAAWVLERFPPDLGRALAV